MTTDSPKGPEREARPSNELLDYLRRLLGQRFDELLATANFLDEDDQASTLAVFEDVLPLVAGEIANRAAAYDLMLSEVRAQRDEWKQAAGAEADLLDQEQAERRAEVSRLREQLAAQPTIPADAEAQIRLAISDPGSQLARYHQSAGEPYETVAGWGARAVMQILRSWGVSSSEGEAPQPEEDDEPVCTAEHPEFGRCFIYASEHTSPGGQDYHESDGGSWPCEARNATSEAPESDEFAMTLRPQPQSDEGRPSGSERLAPRPVVQYAPQQCDWWYDDRQCPDYAERNGELCKLHRAERERYDAETVRICAAKEQDAAQAARSAATPEDLAAHAGVMADQYRQLADFIETHALSPSLRKEGEDRVDPNA